LEPRLLGKISSSETDTIGWLIFNPPSHNLTEGATSGITGRGVNLPHQDQPTTIYITV
jgi:hypothetical protein